MSDFNLNDHIFRLLQQEPFFAALSRKIEKAESKAIPTAGVRVNPDTGYFEMLYNPKFFEGLTDEQRSGVLIHEFYHLVFEHVLDRLPDELAGVMKGGHSRAQSNLFKLWNIGADLSINCLIGKDKLPEMCCFPGVGPFAKMPEGQTAEWYYDELKRMQDEAGDGQGEPGDDSGDGSGGFNPDDAGQFDSHDDWGGEASSDAIKEIAKERLKEATKQAVQEATTRGWGNISSSCREEIMDRIATRVDWRKVLRWFVKCSQRSNKRSTPRRLNRRYPYVHPGRKVERMANVAISIDQSGSVSDAMLATFYAELNNLASLATFTVIPFDTNVAEDKVYVWKKGDRRKKERVLHGGTCFNAPTEYVNKGIYDGHIVLTDMCAPKPKASKCPRMWMTDKNNGQNPYFKTSERIVIIDK